MQVVPFYPLQILTSYFGLRCRTENGGFLESTLNTLYAFDYPILCVSKVKRIISHVCVACCKANLVSTVPKC